MSAKRAGRLSAAVLGVTLLLGPPLPADASAPMCVPGPGAYLAHCDLSG